MQLVDATIIFAFVIYSVASGLRARRAASQSLDEYFLAGRSLPGWKAGLSMAATQFAADTPLLVTGIIATAGIFYLWQLWIYALAFLLLGFVLASSWRRAGVLTDAELTELRYAARPAAVLRGVKAVYFGTLFNCTVLAMVLFATKEIAEPFLHWHQWLPAGLFDTARAAVEWVGMPIARGDASDPTVWIRSTNNILSIGAIVTVTTLYSTTGGLRSVVNTDVVQLAIMLSATALYAWWVLDAGGGLGTITSRIETAFAGGGPGGITPSEIVAFTPAGAKDVTFSVLALLGLQWLVQMNADGTGYLAQRTMACRTDRDAKIASVVFAFTQVLGRSLLWLPIGLGLLVLFPPEGALSLEALRAEREATYVQGIKELLPPGLLGLMLTGMLAALASTVDTHLNWGASYWTNDIYKRFICQAWRKREPGARELVWVARLSNVLILILALVIMTRLTSIQKAWQTSLLLGAGMGVILLLRWLWWRVTAWGEIATIAASTLAAWPLLTWVDDQAVRLLVMAAVATTAGVVTSLLTGPEPAERLHEFYRRAQPPGFWGPVSGKTAGVLRLRRQGAATVTAAFSLFCLLVGAGSWIANSPPPGWLPWPGVWIALNLVVGAALIPVWWRLGGVNDKQAD